MSNETEETRNIDTQKLGPATLGPGTVLSERYRLDAEIGRGGMGQVYRATDLELQREVAVKVLLATLADDAARQRLQREARAAAALNHPHIVSVYDVGEDRGLPFFVMELVPGPNLGQAPPRDLADIVAVALQICEALQHAHSTGIVHRDLKPDNVLFAATGDRRSIKLADLGLAIPARDVRLTAEGAIVGTASYMAPEQALGQTVDGRADLYALGVILYEFCAGRAPFTGDDPLAIISQHVHASPVPPRLQNAKITPALEAVILRLLAKEPGRRFANATETAAALEQALAEPMAGAEAEVAGAIVLLDALSRGRLVGRSEELKQSRELWRRALGGQGHALLVSGDPGAGKTRLARELLIQAALDGAEVLSGACYEYEATTPYLPFVEAFRVWIRKVEDDERLRETLGEVAPEIAKLAPELSARLGPFPARAELSPHEERLYFFDAMARVFRALAAERGLVVYIDDLHWADSSSLGLLGHLVRTLRDETILFVASYREIELDRAHPLAKALVEWNRERLTTRISLRPFDLEETRGQLEALLGEDISTELASAVFRETEGNPFFVEEVVKALIEEGAFRREHGHWERCEVTDLIIPQSVKAAIGNRLDRVSEECNGVLRAAAVLGKNFEFAELALTAGNFGEDTLLDVLDEAASAQLIMAVRDERFAFTHDKIREVLYEELNPIRRRRLHMATAKGLLAAGDVAVETLAHHFIEGGDLEQGLRYAEKAAHEAESVFAYAEAIEAYGRAVECAEALGRDDERAVLEEALGDAYTSNSQLISARSHYERALGLVSEPAARTRLLCRAGSSCVQTGDPLGLEYIREAHANFNADTDPADVAMALTIEARFHHLEGRHRRAIEMLERAASLLAKKPGASPQTTHEHARVTEVYSYLSGAHQHLGLFEDANRWARKAVSYGEEHGVLAAQASGYEFLGENSYGRGEWHKGLEYAAKERKIAERMRSRERLGWACFIEMLCAIGLGDDDLAERSLTAGLEFAKAIGESRLHSLLLSHRPWCLIMRGQFAEALEASIAAVAEADATGILYMKVEARRAGAETHYHRGEFDQALVLANESAALIEGKESKWAALRLGPPHVEILVAGGRMDEARGRAAAYTELVAGCQSPFFAAEADRIWGLVVGAR
jgi:tetratricopeptide (TPR) repeat protein